MSLPWMSWACFPEAYCSRWRSAKLQRGRRYSIAIALVACACACTAQPFQPGQGLLPAGNELDAKLLANLGCQL